MNYELVIQAVVDAVGAQTVVDHVMSIAPSNRVHVAFVLAINSNGTLTADDITAINMVDDSPLPQRPDTEQS